jgi:hypothetical protein
MSFLSVSHNAQLTKGRRSADGSKRLINEESMECSNILASSSQSHHSTSHHSALLAAPGSNGCSLGHSYGAKESTECDVMASDIDSGSSRSQSGSSSGSASLSVSSTPGTKDRVWMVALCTFIVCLTSLLNGMMLGFSSPALTQLQFNVSQEYRISHNDVKFSLFAVSIIIL